MKSAFAKSSRVERPLLLYQLVTVEQHLNVCVGHAAASTRNSKSTSTGTHKLIMKRAKFARSYLKI